MVLRRAIGARAPLISERSVVTIAVITYITANLILVVVILF